MLLALVAILVIAAAAADGVSTNAFVKKGDVEIDPLLIFFYRTQSPSPTRIALTGAALIGAELTGAFTLAHFHPHLVPYLIVGGLVQIGIHVYEVIHNRSL